MSKLTSNTGLDAINAALSIIKGDRLWLKFGHGRFVLLRRDGDQWQVHHTKLEISKEESKDQGYSEDVRSRSRSINLEAHPNGLSHLLRISHREDGGVFWVPAGTGAELPLKEYVETADHLGCEIDNADHAEQLKRYEWFSKVSGLEYGLQLSSGSKSIHSHIFIDTPTAIDDVVRLRRLFVLCLLGDPAVTRPHQPMRFPGFFRKEKAQYQELLSVSDARYSVEDIKAGLQKAFADLGWAFPETLSDDLWADLQRTLKTEINNDECTRTISALLERGDAYYQQQRKEREERRQQRALIYAQKQLTGEFDLFDAVTQLEQRLSPTEAFSAPAHDWDFSGNNHARGMCQWHPGTTNSAWLSQVGGKWVYHCPTCTDDQPIGAFQYWLADRRGPAATSPTGSEWARLAKEWLGLHGVQISKQRISALFLKGKKTNSAVSEIQKLDDKQQQRGNWLKAMAKVAGLPESIKPTREIINSALMAKQLLPAEHTEGTYQPLTLAPSQDRVMYLLDGQKGSRKTSVAIKSLVDAAKLAGLTVLVVVPSRLLSRDASRVLDTVCHLDGSKAESARYLTTCPESLYKFSRQQWDVVIFDEVNEDIKRTFDGSLGVNPELCQRVTERILSTASTIAIANDQMLRTSIKAVQRMADISPQEIVTVQRRRVPSEMEIKLYLDMIGGDAEETDEEKSDDMPSPNDAFYGWLGRLIETIEAGKKVAIPCGSQTKARIIDRTLRAHFKGKRDAAGNKYRGQVLDGPATPTKVKAEFASNPDQWLARVHPAWLIWTPAFNSGVSFESNYFDAQFEVVSVFEGANAASQRGERVRALLDNRIKERHVFVSNRGLPSYPAPSIFTAGYWRNLAIATINGRTEPTDRAIARSIGANEFLEHHRQELIAALDQKPELFEYWAIEARDLYFKLETLKAEWEGNGWALTTADFSDIDVEEWRTAVQAAKQSIIESKARALGKAKPVAAEGQDLAPCSAVRAKKHHLGEQLSHDYERLKDSRWLEAWVIAPDSSGGISAQRVHSLIKMSVEAPDLWVSICRIDTMRAIAAGTDIENVPSMPIPAKEIATAQLLIGCPGVVEILTGKLTEWSKELPIVSKAAAYLRRNSQRLATLSKHAQRILGLQFKETTPVIKCLNKALQMAGAEAATAGRTNKLWRYQLKTEEHAQQKIDRKEEKGSLAKPDDLRAVLRLKTVVEMRQQLATHLEGVIETAARKWQPIADRIAQMGEGEAPTLMPPTIAARLAVEINELLGIAADEDWQPLPVTDEDTLMSQLEACQSFDRYAEVRLQLEAINPDFTTAYWSNLTHEAQTRITGYYQQLVEV